MVLTRREILSVSLAGGAYATGCYGQSAKPSRVFQMSVPTGGELLEAIHSQGVLYALCRSNYNYALSRASIAGKPQGFSGLPLGMYTHLNTRPSGSLVAFYRDVAKNLALSELRQDGSELQRSPVSVAPLAANTVGDQLVGVLKDCSLIVMDMSKGLASTKVDRAVSLAPQAGYTPPYPNVLVERISATAALVIDKTNAHLSVFTVDGHLQSAAQVNSPEITASLKNTATKLSGTERGLVNGRNIIPAMPLVIPMSSGDGSGNVYCLIAPVDPARAQVFQLNQSGAILRRFYFALPDRSGSKSKVPNALTYAEGQVFLAFADGMVASYPIS